MAESAAHLVDEVFPKVGIRQWVLSFPMPVRFILAKNPKIQAKCLTLVHRAITTFIQAKAKQKGFRSKLHPGAVTLIQRFGGSLNLNRRRFLIFAPTRRKSGSPRTFGGPGPGREQATACGIRSVGMRCTGWIAINLLPLREFSGVEWMR